MISGGIATTGGDISEALMTPEEIEAVIDAAHRFGRKVTAHSGSPKATITAVDLGIDCIEHGYMLNREALVKMKENDVWLVPTMVVTQPETNPLHETFDLPAWYKARREAVGKLHLKAIQMAIEEGVNIALGTDFLPAEPANGTTVTVVEAELYVEGGDDAAPGAASSDDRAGEASRGRRGPRLTRSREVRGYRGGAERSHERHPPPFARFSSS